MADDKQTLSVAELKSFPMFQDLEPGEILAFLQAARVRLYGPQRPLVFRQGDEADGMYIILSGEVDVFQTDTALRRHLLGTLGRGEFFGEMSLLEEKGRAATVEARGETRMIFLAHDGFKQLQAGQPVALCKIFLRMMAEMSSRLRTLGSRYVSAKAALGSLSGF